MEYSYDYLCKILLIGDTGVGKSSIVSKYVDNVWSENFVSTIGVDFRIKTIELPDKKRMKFQIWDTAGQERFKSVTTSYYRGAHGIFVVFDLTNRESFEHIQKWLDDIQQYAPYAVVYLIANKSDRPNVVVTDKEIQDLGIPYQKVSAKSDINLDEAFYQMGTLIREEHYRRSTEEGLKPVINIYKSKRRGKCCS